MFTETDERFWVGVDSSRDDGWVDHLQRQPADQRSAGCWPPARPKASRGWSRPRRQGVEYDVEPAGDRLLITHNVDAEDFELAEAPLDAVDAGRTGRRCSPHEPGVRMLGVDAYASHAVVSLRRDGLTGLHVLPRSSRGDLGAGRRHRLRRAAVHRRFAGRRWTTSPTPSGSPTARC